MNSKLTRRQQIALRSFTYGVMTLAVLVGAAFCLFWAMGFRFDLQSGQISQVALLQFNSFPTGATVSVNGAPLTSATPTRFNVKTGETTVEMTKSGYRAWSKTVNALPSSVRWLNYARLIPQNITTESIKSFAAVDQMAASPDRRYLALHQAADSRDITLVNLANPAKPQFSTLTLDAAQLTAPSEGAADKIAIVEWDQGSRYLLLKHSVGDQVEYLELDRQNPTATKNLTRDFNMALADPHFSGTSGQVFFALTGTDLRKFDYGSQSVSAPLVSNVQNYRPYGGGRLAYVAAPTSGDKTQQIVGIYDDGRAQTVKTYDDVAPTLAEFAEYDGTQYLAVARGDSVAIYQSPLSANAVAQPPALKAAGRISQFEFSPSGRFVLAADGQKFVSYDLETGETYAFELNQSGDPLNWIDDYHVADYSGGAIALVEFDGGNRTRIVSGRGAAALSTDGKYLFSLSDAAGGAVLQRSQLVLN